MDFSLRCLVRKKKLREGRGGEEVTENETATEGQEEGREDRRRAEEEGGKKGGRWMKREIKSREQSMVGSGEMS